jgi:hypothetical protein
MDEHGRTPGEASQRKLKARNRATLLTARTADLSLEGSNFQFSVRANPSIFEKGAMGWKPKLLGNSGGAWADLFRRTPYTRHFQHRVLDTAAEQWPSTARS